MAAKTPPLLKNHGEILNDLLREHNISNAEFHNNYRKFAACSAGKANGLTHHTKKTFKREEICLLCTVFGFSPTSFGLPADAFKSPYGQRLPSRPLDSVFSNESAAQGGKDHSDYIQQFFGEINRYLLNTRESLHVCDYIAARQGIKQKAPLDQYIEHDRSYFEQIERRLAERQFEYHRIIQLPLGSQVRNFSDALEIVAEELLPDTFAHLCRCLRDYPDCCHFYIVLHPFRLYTYYLVDQQTILTEYPRFDKSGVPVPDLLFVNHHDPDDPQAVGSRYIRSSVLEFRRMAEAKSNHNHRLTRTLLITALKSLHVQLRADLEALNQQGNGDLQVIADGLAPGNWTNVLLNEVGERDRQRDILQDRLAQLEAKLEIARKLYPQTDDKA